MDHNFVPILELPVPKTMRAVIGGTICTIMLTTFTLFSVGLAIYNLCNWTAIIPSTIWLLLVGFFFSGLIKTDGCKKITTDILGTFSKKEFIRTISLEKGQTAFQYGFKIFGHWFSYFTVAVETIETVKWDTGQASDMAGRDMNDWHVAVWYDHDDPAKSQKQNTLKKPDQDLYIVGMSGAKAETAALGFAVVDLLRKTGATFAQGDDDCTFVRRPSSVA